MKAGERKNVPAASVIKVAKLLLLLSLSGCFLAQVWDACIKYANKSKTVVFETLEGPEHLAWPMIGVCPKKGYKEEEMKELGLEEHQWNLANFEDSQGRYLAPENKEQILDWHQRTTYATGEILEKLDVYRPKSAGTNLIKGGKLNQESLKKEKVSVSSIPSIAYGNCALLKFSTALETSYDVLILVLRDLPGGVKIYTSADGSETAGFPLRLFMSEVRAVDLKYRSQRGISLKKSLTVQDPVTTGCQMGLSFREEAKCINEEARMAMLLSANDPSCSYCYHPLLEYWVPKNVSVCGSFHDASCTHKAIISSLYDKSPCPDPCSMESVSFYTDDEIQDDSNVTSLYLVYQSPQVVEVRRERLLYDFGTILGSVGGSLGLFLGFSFLDVSNRMLDYIGTLFLRA